MRPGVAIAAGAVITDDGATIASARVVLTNASAGDVLSVAGGLPGGISSSVDTSVPGADHSEPDRHSLARQLPDGDPAGAVLQHLAEPGPLPTASSKSPSMTAC